MGNPRIADGNRGHWFAQDLRRTRFADTITERILSPQEQAQEQAQEHSLA